MANLSLTRVNQKIAQARHLVHSAEASHKAIQRASVIEATAFHLVCAYQHYLREIAETYGLKGATSIADEVSLIEAFALAHKHPAEAEELVALRQDSNSWLTQLHTYYQSLWSQPKPTKTQTNDNFINLIEIEAMAVDAKIVQGWLNEFVQLIQRQRETSAEF